MRIYRFMPLLLVFCTSCIPAMADHTLRTRNESFPARGVSAAVLETGAGILSITGRSDLSAIEVKAEFKCRGIVPSDSQRILDNLRLEMEVRGETFYLKSERLSDWNWGDSGWIDLIINMPKDIDLDVNDGSGSIDINGMGRNIRIKDGSGGIELTDNDGSIQINDGSGSIHVRKVRQNVDIHDGSGSIDVRYVDGNLQIHDGSGSIEVDDVGGDLIIPSDGSGSIRVRNARRNVEINDGSGSINVQHVGGNVRIRDGSGSIDVNDVEGDLDIPSGGSGSIHYSRILGKVDVPKKHR